MALPGCCDHKNWFGWEYPPIRKAVYINSVTRWQWNTPLGVAISDAVGHKE